MLFSYLEGGVLTLNALTNLYRFVRQFIFYWQQYPAAKSFAEKKSCSPELKKLIELYKASDKYDKFYRSRLSFAWESARVWWRHRDRYSRICTGDCEQCDAKHC